MGFILKVVSDELYFVNYLLVREGPKLALIFSRNKYLGIMKGLDAKQWQMGHIVRLRTAGMEDITVD